MVQRHQDWCAVVCSFPRLGTALQRTGVQAGLLAIGVAHRLNGEETECLLEGAVSGEQVQVMSGLMCTGLWDEVRGNTLDGCSLCIPPGFPKPDTALVSMVAALLLGLFNWGTTARLHSCQLLEKGLKFWEGLGLQCYIPGIS